MRRLRASLLVVLFLAIGVAVAVSVWPASEEDPCGWTCYSPTVEVGR
ncbi:hypothetical protein GKE82_14420 [Conexibacter sp. W3-3-2]|nr:hypothetical protein [Conexibacter sp. W3-3-2]MTD45449.1 hypothetical protein [Conexibacter sp. W3-3-2]